MNKWAKLKRMTWVERRLLLQTWLLLPVVTVLLRVAGLRRSQELLARLPFRSSLFTFELSPAQTGRLIQTAARFGWPAANCLSKSLTLWWLLRCNDVPSELRIGVRKDAAVFSAHAWVEHQGCVVNDGETVGERFQPFSEPFDLVEQEIRP